MYLLALQAFAHSFSQCGVELGVLDVSPTDAAGVILALKAPLQAALAEGVRAVGGDWVSDDTHAELALEQLLGEVHELLPGLELCNSGTGQDGAEEASGT